MFKPVTSKRAFSALLLLGTFAPLLHAAPAQATEAAPVVVEQAWIRATVKGQTATGGFMTVTSATGATLLGFSSPAARSHQLHEMRMEGDVMRMRQIMSLPLPAGQAVQLQPGGLHLMLVGLKKPLQDGSMLPVELRLKTAAGKEVKVKVQVPVAKQPPTGAATGMPAMGDHHHH